jgi:D-alanyl-D-alanine carboxypeptidase
MNLRDNIKLIVLTAIFWVLCFYVGNLYQISRVKEIATVNAQAQSAPVQDQILGESVTRNDTQAPEVLAVYNKSPVVSEQSYIEIKVNELLDTTLTPLVLESNDSNSYTYKYSISGLKEGVNEVDLSLADAAGNATTQQFRITRYSVMECLEKRNGSIETVQFPNALDTVVDKFHKLPDNYAPPDLINGRNYGIPTLGGSFMRELALDPLKQMLKDIQAARIDVTVSSGYRSIASQQKVYNQWVSNVGAANANQYAALPGFSEHHLGTAFDLLTNENGHTTVPSFENTRLGKWLKANAFRYGFVMSYPKGMQQITGYNFEPWHWRYVGPELAVKINESGKTPVEYFYMVNNINCGQ